MTNLALLLARIEARADQIEADAPHRAGAVIGLDMAAEIVREEMAYDEARRMELIRYPASFVTIPPPTPREGCSDHQDEYVDSNTDEWVCVRCGARRPLSGEREAQARTTAGAWEALRDACREAGRELLRPLQRRTPSTEAAECGASEEGRA